MPKDQDDATASAPKPVSKPSILYELIFIVCAVVLLGLGIVFARSKARCSINACYGSSVVPTKATQLTGLQVEGGSHLDVETVQTAATREKGLSDRDVIGSNGMLFLFDAPAMYGFWMKNMRFAIDIVWIDSDKKVIYVSMGADPSTYPQEFYPASEAKYVLEVNAGKASAFGLTPGKQLSW